MLTRFRQLASNIGRWDAGLFFMARACARATGGRLRLKKFYLYAQPVATKELTPPRRGRSIDVQEATLGAIRTTDFGRPATVIEYRLKHQCRCLLAFKAERMVGFQWFSLQNYPEDEVRCLYELDPRDRCAWDFDIFVAPEARTLPTFLRLWDGCNDILRAAGIDLSLSRIDAFNSASRRSHGSLGARAIGWGLFILAGRLQVSVFSSSPWLHVSGSPRSSPSWPVSRLARRQNCTHIADSSSNSP
jgi:hypothetical protein